MASAVQQGRTSALSVAEACLARVTAYAAVQPAVWITRVADEAVRHAALSIDARIAAGERPPLAGVPFAVKDNIDVAGLPTTAGCPAFAYQAAETAPVVQRLLDAGAVLIGKTNLDQFATGLVGTRSPYGALGCVFNRQFISGGSSSGSAVAVAAGLVGFALGTDTAGSGRVPAAFNHLTGFKPTPGRWSTRGLVPACRSLDCVSVFTSTAGEAALIDELVAGFDEADPYSRQAPGEAPQVGRPFRLGIPPPRQLLAVDSASRRRFVQAVERLAAVGAQVVEVDTDFLREAGALLYQGPWVAERTAAVGALLQNQPEAIEPVVREILEGGRRFSAVDAFEAQYALAGLRRKAEAMWRHIEALLLPTAPTIFRIAEVAAEPLALNAQLGRYTNFVNLLGMSAIAIPAGFHHNWTGFGVSLIGPPFADRALIDLAQAFEESSPMADAPPLDLAGVQPMVTLAVVGAHLEGMPLHWQLASRGARLVRRCRTASVYRLYAMAGSTPPKPALAHMGAEGAAIEIEVYELGVEAFGSFTAEVPAPLAIGTVELEDGTEVKGFVAEPRALIGAEDITAFGGWRAYVASLGKR